MKKALVYSAAIVALATLGLVGAITIGVSDPAIALRVYMASVGLTGCWLAVTWMRHPGRLHDARNWRPKLGAGPGGGSGPDPDYARGTETSGHPALQEMHSLGGRMRMATKSSADYQRLVRPRLSALAASRLAHHGVSLNDAARAEDLLGPAFELVDPRLARVIDRHGVDLAKVNQLLDILEGL